MTKWINFSDLEDQWLFQTSNKPFLDLNSPYDIHLVGGLVAMNLAFSHSYKGLMSSSQLTNSIIFQRGSNQPPTRKVFLRNPLELSLKAWIKNKEHERIAREPNMCVSTSEIQRRGTHVEPRRIYHSPKFPSVMFVGKSSKFWQSDSED